jgi:pimeloyl-ACP methyl ester carboxylesterase
VTAPAPNCPPEFGVEVFPAQDFGITMKTIELVHRSMVVAYDEMGTGLPVVLLHAFPFDRTMWAPQLGPLSAAGFRVIAPDLPEFGDSTPGGDVITIERAADVVADFLDALHITRAVVGGLSMGGYVALAFARRHPQRLAGLILADTKAAPDDDEAKARRDDLIAAVNAGGPVAAADALLPKVVSDRTREKNPAAVETLRQIALRQTSAGVIAGLYALRDRPDAAPGLPSVAVPTLVLVGEFDTVTPPLAAARLSGTIRKSELVHVPGTGHISNVENPEAFNAAVVAFLKKLT